MIINFFIEAIIAIVGVIFSPFPTVTQLPFGVDASVQAAFQAWNRFLYDMPPIAYVWNLTLLYFGILVALFILRIIIGARIPHGSASK